MSLNACSLKYISLFRQLPSDANVKAACRIRLRRCCYLLYQLRSYVNINIISNTDAKLFSTSHQPDSGVSGSAALAKISVAILYTSFVLLQFEGQIVTPRMRDAIVLWQHHLKLRSNQVNSVKDPATTYLVIHDHMSCLANWRDLISQYLTFPTLISRCIGIRNQNHKVSRYHAVMAQASNTFQCDMDTEPLERYRKGRYHPTHLGDRFKDGRYEIMHKLGWGASQLSGLQGICCT